MKTKTKRKAAAKKRAAWEARPDGLEEYDVIEARNLPELIWKHDSLVENGWRAQGGVAVFAHPLRLFQAMVRGGR